MIGSVKMKVGILTFPNSPSHGATLQMCALYQSVKKLGHEAEILNYQSQWMKDGLHMYENPLGLLTNNPPFLQQMFHLNNYLKYFRYFSFNI